jgi:cell division protein FtsN
MGALSGLAAGLAVAVLVYVHDHRADTGLTHGVKIDHKRVRNLDASPDADVAEAGPGADDPGKSPYAFYDMLPKFEVVVPEKEKDVRPDTRSVPETRRGTYVLQAGSYKNFADADRVRAQLALQGVDAKVQKVSVDNDTWHRIRIGPISNLDELNRLRTRLRKADVDVLVIRVGD